MTKEEFAALRTGSIVQNLGSGEAYIVTAVYGERATAVRTIDMHNPSEWKLVEPPAVRPSA